MQSQSMYIYILVFTLLEYFFKYTSRAHGLYFHILLTYFSISYNLSPFRFQQNFRNIPDIFHLCMQVHISLLFLQFFQSSLQNISVSLGDSRRCDLFTVTVFHFLQPQRSELIKRPRRLVEKSLIFFLDRYRSLYIHTSCVIEREQELTRTVFAVRIPRSWSETDDDVIRYRVVSFNRYLTKQCVA